MPKNLDKHFESFERFYAIYPHKKARFEAEAEWLKIKPDDELAEKIIEAVETQVKAGILKDDKWTPHPRRWLHGGRWMDILPQKRTTENPKCDCGCGRTGRAQVSKQWFHSPECRIKILGW